jgi:hypothetical protein
MADVMNAWVEKVQAERAAKGEVLHPPETPVQEQARKTAVVESEQQLVAAMIANAGEATELQTKTMAKLGDMIDRGGIRPGDMATVLRGISDAQAKSIDAFLKLTGRAGGGAAESDTVSLIRSMARDGLLRVNVELGPQADES